LEDAEPHTRWSQDIDAATRTVLCDAQTSGGLLIAVPAARTEALLDLLRRAGTPAAALIGEVTAGPPGTIEIL
jgi:selenide,water dikinase